MKKIISFKKNIEFPSMIGEVTAISLDHTLKFVDESNITGDFRVTGSYKLTEASRLEENFDYTIPTEIVLPEKLDLETTKISIADFYYELASDVTMICYIDAKIEGVEIIDDGLETNKDTIEEKKTIEPAIPSPLKEEQETRCVEKETKNERECDGEKIMEETSEEQVEIISNETAMSINNENIENIITTNNDNNLSEKAGSLFTSLDSSEETFSTYSVYILRQEETVQSIIEKYHISKEELENYNDLSNLSVGTKIIIPNTKE